MPAPQSRLQTILDAIHKLRAVIADPLKDVDQRTDPRFKTYPLANWWDPAPIREAGELVLRCLTEEPLDARQCPPKVRDYFGKLHDRLTRHQGEPVGWERYTLWGDYHDDWLVFLDDLVALLLTCPGVHPAEPTLEFCLPKRGVVRWVRQADNVPPRLWWILYEFFAGGCQPLAVNDVLGRKKAQTVRNYMNELREILELVDFRWLLVAHAGLIEKKLR
jgi:hypothetical protein